MDTLSEFKPSQKEIERLYKTLYSSCYKHGDISRFITIKFCFEDLNEETLAVTRLSDNDIKTLKQKSSIIVVISFNNKVYFTENLFKEVLLHEMIHLYHLTIDANGYTNKLNEHGALFREKTREVSSRAGFFIRPTLDLVKRDNRLFAVSFAYQNIDFTPLKNNSDIILISTNINNVNFDFVTRIPRQYTEVVLKYLNSINKTKYNWFERLIIKNEFFDSELIESIPFVFGDFNEEIEENILSLNSLILKRAFSPNIKPARSLPKLLLLKLQKSEKEYAYN